MDNAATTPLRESVKDLICKSMNCFCNPSSKYKPANDEYVKIVEARDMILTELTDRIDKYRICFTSGGTESNNWIINSIVESNKGSYKNKIITTSIEHPSVYNTMKHLESNGYDVVYIKPDRTGVISPSAIENEIDERTILVSVMAVNNQIGSVQPLKEIGSICKNHDVPFHSDCVQAVGHIPINMDEMNLDFITASSHKFGGMKGVGFVVANKEHELNNMMYGGKQNYGLRPGTENVTGITTTALALKECCDNMDESIKKVDSMRRSIVNCIGNIDHIVNGSPVNYSPFILNLSFKNISGVELAILLEANDIMVSTTSACETGVEKSNRILEEVKVPEDYIDGTIRISLSESNSQEECDLLIDLLSKYCAKDVS